MFVSQAQETAFGNQTVDEFLRRKSLVESANENTGWMLRSASASVERIFYQSDSLSRNKKLFEYGILPIYFNTRLDGKRPYIGGEYGLIPSRGVQTFLSTGIKARFSILDSHLNPVRVSTKLAPELVAIFCSALEETIVVAKTFPLMF